jgi:hypothetical protein
VLEAQPVVSRGYFCKREGLINPINSSAFPYRSISRRRLQVIDKKAIKSKVKLSILAYGIPWAQGVRSSNLLAPTNEVIGPVK